MTNGSKLITNEELTIEDMDELIKECKFSQRLYQRLVFLKCVKQGNTITFAADLVGVTRQTGARWIKSYNENGLWGLIPKFGGGRPSYLSDEQKAEIRSIVTQEDLNYSISDVRKLILSKYNIEYSYKQVWVIIKKQFGLNYGKPFPLYDNRPDTAKEDLKKKLAISI
ncbi:MAG: helix-turn-helix domain-containing protein [Methanobrevibacter sp.]|jgi:putative transposase|nr:helix-turn-helix domain-containing protein [Candidatus Methanoflexus mossambicus]